MKSTRRQLLSTSAALAALAAMPFSSAFAETQNTNGGPGAQSSKKPADNALEDAVSLSDFEAAAHSRMSHMAWEYINSGVADEITLRWNREAFDRIRLNTHILRDLGKVNTRVKLLGQELAFPVMLAPSSLHKLAYAEGEAATARGAGKADATMVLSTMSSVSVEDVTKAASRPVWFQLYVQKDRGFTESLVARAESCGCKALVVTVDTPVGGARNRQERAKFHLPPGIEFANLKGMKTEGGVKLRSETNVFDNILPENLTWKDIDWLQKVSKVPVLLKGVLNPDDADIAAKSGVAGILVSNHGARNLDTVPASIDALPRVADKVAGRIVVLMDGGVRRGTDILKALALGANAVLIGRPVLYGLATGGADGVTRVLNILRQELEMAMILTGQDDAIKVDRSVLWT